MGKVYINDVEIGTFYPQSYPSSGNAFINNVNIGTFNFESESGKVYLDGVEIGTYSGLSGILPPEVYGTLELGTQWGLLVWSPSQKKWLRAGTPVT